MMPNNKQHPNRRMRPKLFCVESAKTNKTTTEIPEFMTKVAKLIGCTFGATNQNQ